MENQKDIDTLIKEIDKKLEEMEKDISYDEKEGKEQVDKISDYMQEKPEATEEAFKKILDQKESK